MSGATWVTGAHGFIGRHVVAELARRGEAVAGIGHGAWAEPDRLAAGLTAWLNADIDAASLTTLAQQAGPPGAVIHLAGGSSVMQSLRAPHEDFHRTVATSLSLLDWLRVFAPDVPVVFTSSAAVYGGGHDGNIGETAAIAPVSPSTIARTELSSKFKTTPKTSCVRTASLSALSFFMSTVIG